MKFRHIIHILAILAVIACFLPPVMAADTPATDEATASYNRGERFLQINDFENAILAFDQALASNTTMIEQSDALLYIYRDKAFAQIQLGKYDDAVSTTEQGLYRYPKDEKLWNNKGYAFHKLQRYPDALAAYDRAIGIDKEYTKALINKGDTLSQMGRYQDAVSAYTAALSTDPGNRDATAGLATAQKAADSANIQTMIILAVAVAVIIIAGGAIWYLKYRNTSENRPEKKTLKGKKK